MYQAGVNERLLGDFIRKHNVRDKIFSTFELGFRVPPLPFLNTDRLDLIVASKCGFDVFGDGSVTNSASHIKQYIEGTIDRLGFAPDLYYLHRIDPGMWPNRGSRASAVLYSPHIFRDAPRGVHRCPRRNSEARKDQVYRAFRMLRKHTSKGEL